MSAEDPVSHADLNTELQRYVMRVELEQLLQGLTPQIQLAVVNGVKEALPAVLTQIDDRYGQTVKEMKDTLYNKESGLVIMVDRMSTLTKEIPALIKMRWQLYGIILASNIIAIIIGWWAATNFMVPRAFIQQVPSAASMAAAAPAARPR